MQLREALHDRQAQPEAAVAARGRGVFLPEAFEHEGQERRRDADARVLDDDLGVRVHPLQRHAHLAARRRELHRVGEQVPQDLLKPRRIDFGPADVAVERLLDADSLGVCRGAHRFDGVADGVAKIERLQDRGAPGPS